MAVKFTNNAATTLAAGINSSVTSIAVTDGSVYPTITGSDYFYVTFDDGTNKEIVKVTARNSNTLTVVRGHDNTSARAFSSGDKAELRVVAALLADVIAGVGSSALNVDTFSGNGSATGFTLSTTPAGEDNLIVFIEGVYQNPADFTLSGTTLTFDVAPANSRKVIVYHVAALVSGNNLTHNQFTCNGSTTAFTLSLAPIHENNTQVFLNGVYQHKNTYAVSGTTLTLDTAPTNGVILEVMSFTQTDVNTLPAAFVSGLTQVTAVGADHFMIFDATDSALKKSLVSDVLESATSISTSADATAITIDSSENVTFTGTITAVGTSVFTNLDISGDIDVDGTTNLDVVDIDGAVDMATTLNVGGTATFTGLVDAAIIDGVNFKVNGGQGSDGQVLTSTGSGVAWEDAAGGGPTSKTFGTSSIMIGDDATGTIDAANYNTGVGVDVFAALTTGDNNTGVGFKALTGNTTGAGNTAFGKGSGYRITTGNDNTVLGHISDYGGDAMTSSSNTFVGRSAGERNTTGNSNTFIGALCGDLATTGNTNTGVGSSALTALTTGYNNASVGASSMQSTTTGHSNAALGSGALSANTTAANNTAVGYASLGANTTGAGNTAVGAIALDAITTSSNNTAVGHEALTNASSGQGNTALGKGTMVAVVTGSNNTAVGLYALGANTNASNNVAVGHNALTTCTTGARNTAVGQNALNVNLGGEENIAIGASAGIRNNSGSRNIAIGYRGHRGNTTGSDCIIVGSDASYTNCTGSKNIAIGNNAGYNWTTAYNNCVIGYNARTDEYNSYGAITIGYNGLGYASEHVTFVNGSNKTYVAIGSTNWAGTSDQRLKENIQTSTAGLSFINDLRPITYDWKKKKDIDNTLEAYESDNEDRYIARNGTNNHGFLAQEVKTALDNHSEVLSGSEIWSESKDGTQGISETALIPMLVKALQEADDKIDALTARIETLEG